MDPFDFKLANSLPPEQQEAYRAQYIAELFSLAYHAEDEMTRLQQTTSKLYENLCVLVYRIRTEKITPIDIHNYIMNEFFFNSESDGIRNLSIDDILEIGKEKIENDKKLKEVKELDNNEQKG